MRALSNEEIVGTFPTSITQKRCWFMEQIHPGNRGLNLAVRWELRGAVSSDAVERAFQLIVDRHEILRTRFVERDGTPVQEVAEKVEFKLGRVDIRNLPAADRAGKIEQIAIEHVDEGFDLGEPCLLRVAMVRIEADRAALLISVHNSIFDGYSIGVLGHELGTILEAQEKGETPDLPELNLQYGDFAMWLEDYEASGALVEEEKYWIETLKDMPYFELQPDRPRVAGEPLSRSYATDLPADFSTRLSDAAKALETSVFSLGTAAFSAALERFSGRSDVSFAFQVAGRNDVDLEPLIGIFTNPVVLRFDVKASDTFSEHARATRDIVNGALAHQNLAFDKLVQVLNPPRDPLRIPLVSIMFNLQRAFLNERKYGSIELVSVQSHSPGTLYDLNVNIVGRNTGWRMVIDYNAKLFDEHTISRLSKLIVAAFDAIMHQVESPISALQTAPEPASTAQPAATQDAGDRTPYLLSTQVGSDTVQRLTRIWSELLALPSEQVKGDFFDLGGYSVLALRMLSKVEEEFGRRPQVHAFLATPTLHGLAGLLDQRGQADPEPPADVSDDIGLWEMVELRSASKDAPVLLTVNQPFMYQALAREMSADCAVVNISIAGQEQLSALKDAGFDKAITDATERVLARYSGRAFLMCGLCVDGRVALRLAQRLGDEGQSVHCVAMIDTWAPLAIKEFSNFAMWRDRWRIRMRRLNYYLGLRRQKEITWADVLRQNDFAAKCLSWITKVPPRNEAETLVNDTVDHLVSQTRHYAFEKYDGEVVLFITRSQGLMPRDGVLGWSGLLPRDVSVHRVNGWHGEALMRSGFERIIGVLDAKARRLNSRDGPTL